MVDEFLAKIISFIRSFGCIFIAVVFIVIFYIIRRRLLNSFYYMQDYTTGFLKVRERLIESTHVSLDEMVHNPSADEYDDYALEIGKIENSMYDETIRLPGSLRSTHIYMVGASGAGKSSLMKNLLIQDIQNGMGLCVIDPHGDLVHDLIPFLGQRKEQTLMLNLEDIYHVLVA